MIDLTTRQLEPEWMDAPDVDPMRLERSLRFIRRINLLLGYTRATIRHLDGFSRTWRPGEPIWILDVATGSGDIPRGVLRWAARRGHDVRMVGVDLHPLTARIARASSATSGRLSIVQGNAIGLPFADGSFDYALTAMFLHHLEDALVVRALREMNRVVRRGVIVADLLRHRRAYAWITILSAFADPIVRHDARVSVAQAFTRAEVLALRERAGIGFADYFRHFGHRFALAGEKPRGPAPTE